MSNTLSKPEQQLPDSSVPTFEVREEARVGRGVYSLQDVPAGVVLWRDPIVIFPTADTAILETMGLANYYYLVDDIAFLCLGNGSLLNHAKSANCDFHLDAIKRELIFTSLTTIRAGEQLTIDYGWDEYPWEAVADIVVANAPR